MPGTPLSWADIENLNVGGGLWVLGCEARRTGQIPRSEGQASLGVGRVYNLEVFVYLSQLDLDNNQASQSVWSCRKTRCFRGQDQFRLTAVQLAYLAGACLDLFPTSTGTIRAQSQT